jgi:hypothetical protein
MSSHRLWAISPGPSRRLQGNHLCEKVGGSEWDRGRYGGKKIPVSERTCLLLGRGPVGGGLPMAEVSIVEAIVRGKRTSE